MAACDDDGPDGAVIEQSAKGSDLFWQEGDINQQKLRMIKYMILSMALLASSCASQRANSEKKDYLKYAYWQKEECSKSELKSESMAIDHLIENIRKEIDRNRNNGNIYFGIPANEIIHVQRGDFSIFALQNPLNKDDRIITFDGYLIILRVSQVGDGVVAFVEHKVHYPSFHITREY